MIKYNTTTWLFDVNTGKIDKVVDQYRDTKEAMAGALRLIKALYEDEGMEAYIIVTQNMTLNFMGSRTEGIALITDSLPVGFFIPNAYLEKEVPPIVIWQGKAIRMNDATFH